MDPNSPANASDNAGESFCQDRIHWDQSLLAGCIARSRLCEVRAVAGTDSITDEKADVIYLDGKETEITENWDLGDGTIQSARGIAPLHIVREGNYKSTIELKHSEDLTQTQKFEIRFGVQYRNE